MESVSVCPQTSFWKRLIREGMRHGKSCGNVCQRIGIMGGKTFSLMLPVKTNKGQTSVFRFCRICHLSIKVTIQNILEDLSGDYDVLIELADIPFWIMLINPVTTFEGFFAYTMP